MTNAIAVTTMKAAKVIAPRAGLRIVDLEIPDPGLGQVRIKVQACGVCHSDAIIVEGLRPGIPIRAFRAMKWRAWWMRLAVE